MLNEGRSYMRVKPKESTSKVASYAVIALFDADHVWIDSKAVSSNATATWPGLTQARYIIEVYKEPNAGQFFTEFLGLNH